MINIQTANNSLWYIPHFHCLQLDSIVWDENRSICVACILSHEKLRKKVSTWNSKLSSWHISWQKHRCTGAPRHWWKHVPSSKPHTFHWSTVVLKRYNRMVSPYHHFNLAIIFIIHCCLPFKLFSSSLRGFNQSYDAADIHHTMILIKLVSLSQLICCVLCNNTLACCKKHLGSLCTEKPAT